MAIQTSWEKAGYNRIMILEAVTTSWDAFACVVSFVIEYWSFLLY